MRRKHHWLFGALALMIGMPGCTQDGNPGEVPASKDAASTHAAIENPSGIKEKKAVGKAANDLPPQPPK